MSADTQQDLKKLWDIQYLQSIEAVQQLAECPSVMSAAEGGQLAECPSVMSAAEGGQLAECTFCHVGSRRRSRSQHCAETAHA